MIPKPCPFCGWKPVKRRKVHCANLHDPCPLRFVHMTEADWNRRAPLTVADALEVPEVRNALRRLYELGGSCAELDAFKSALAARKEEP